jgi:hypothetical protein
MIAGTLAIEKDFAMRDHKTSRIAKQLAVLGVLVILFMSSAVYVARKNNSNVSPTSESDPGPGKLTALFPNRTLLNINDCVPSGKGTDYRVGPPGEGQYPSLESVPWELLRRGDTVRIAYSEMPYLGKILVVGEGTMDAPIRICGVRGPNGERPVIDGNGAATRKQLEGMYGNATYDTLIQSRAVIMIKNDYSSSSSWTSFPKNIQIDGLNIRGAAAGNRFTTTGGVSAKYDAFGACIWIDRGENIVIADNEINDCTNGIFSKSTNDGSFAVTRNIKISGNYIHDNGVVGDDHEHNVYVQSKGVIYEYNHFGPLRKGSGGNAIKDRSIGSIVRYNRIEGGAHAIDLVEAEDYALIATKDPQYRSSYVYGNQIVKSGDTGSFIHYGGDHYGAPSVGEISSTTWGEPIFRKGKLYFFNNTVVASGREARLFQLATTDESAEVWNNIFVLSSGLTGGNLYMRAPSSGIGAAWTAGGKIHLGVNWISSGWSDSDKYHVVGGELSGSSNIVSGRVSPINAKTLQPLPKSSVIDAGEAGPSMPTVHPVNAQLTPDFQPAVRTLIGTNIDLGAIEWSADMPSSGIASLWWKLVAN